MGYATGIPGANDKVFEALTIFQGSISKSFHEQRACEGQKDRVPCPDASVFSIQGRGRVRQGSQLLCILLLLRLFLCYQILLLKTLLGPRACLECVC